jgi:hypothetical protein
VLFKSLNRQNKIENTTHGYKLNVNDEVRLIEPKKARYNVIPCYDTITDISAKSITITTTDGWVKTITRS